MVEIIDFPIRILSPKDITIGFQYNNQPGQDATNGMRRSTRRNGALFRLKLEGIPIACEPSARIMRAICAQMEGDSTLVRVRVPDWYGLDGVGSAADRARQGLYPGGVPFAAGALFSSGVGFAPSFLSGFLSASATLNARTIYIEHDGELPGGTLISIPHQTAQHGIQHFVYTMRRCWDEGGGINRVEISPPLRKATSAGAEIEYAPIFVGVCTTENPGFEPLEWGTFGRFSLEFIEDLTRLVDLS